MKKKINFLKIIRKKVKELLLNDWFHLNDFIKDYFQNYFFKNYNIIPKILKEIWKGIEKKIEKEKTNLTNILK